MFVQYNQKWKVVTKNKMDNPRFIDEDTIPLVHQDEDYDECNTPNTSKIDETSFIGSDTTEVTSILRLIQKVKRDKLTALYRHLSLQTFALGFIPEERNFFTNCWPLLSQKVDMSNHRQKTHPCWSGKASRTLDYGKVVHHATLWMTPLNIQDVNVFLAHVCERF